MITAVAAAASVPSSLTSTNALCTTSLISRSRPVAMPEKSAPLKAEGIPSAANWSLSENSEVTRKRGRETLNSDSLHAASHRARLSGVRRASSSGSPPGVCGSRMIIVMSLPT